MSCFSKIFENNTEFISLSKGIDSLNAPVGAIGLNDINKVFLVHSLCAQKRKPAFIITPDEASAVKFYENLSQLQKGVFLFSKREFTFLEVEGISREYEHLRLGVLSKIINSNYTAIVASVGAAIQLTMPPEALRERIFKISTGDSLDLEQTAKRLIKATPVLTRLTERVSLQSAAEFLMFFRRVHQAPSELSSGATRLIQLQISIFQPREEARLLKLLKSFPQPRFCLNQRKSRQRQLKSLLSL